MHESVIVTGLLTNQELNYFPFNSDATVAYFTSTIARMEFMLILVQSDVFADAIFLSLGKDPRETKVLLCCFS